MLAREVVDALFESFAEADAERVAALFHESGRQQVYSTGTRLPVGGTIEGREALAAHYRALWRRWTIVGIKLDELVIDGGRVAVRATVDVTDGEGQRSTRTEVMHFLIVEDGRIRELDIFIEDAAARQIHQPEPRDDTDQTRRPS